MQTIAIPRLRSSGLHSRLDVIQRHGGVWRQGMVIAHAEAVLTDCDQASDGPQSECRGGSKLAGFRSHVVQGELLQCCVRGEADSRIRALLHDLYSQFHDRRTLPRQTHGREQSPIYAAEALRPTYGNGPIHSARVDGPRRRRILDQLGSGRQYSSPFCDAHRRHLLYRLRWRDSYDGLDYSRT